ncbi:MAG: hypothetical protein ACYDG2_10800 [Ruminiclostridium sp.]
MINLEKLQTRIQKFATIKYIVISTVILFSFASLLRSDTSSLNMRFGYSSDVAYKLINALGYSGRQSYISFLT